MTTIESIDLIPVSIPYKWPVHWAYGTLTAGEHVIVRLVLDDGTVGLAEGIPRLSIYGETQRSIMEIITDEIAPRIVGGSLWDPTLGEAIASGIVANNVAKGAMEQALWHARARNAGVPLRRMLGGEDSELPVAWMLSLLSLDEMLEDAKAALGRGYRKLKVKGGIDADFDIEVFRKLKEAAPEVEAYIDANQGYSWPEALRISNALAPYGLTFIEEPMDIVDPMRPRLYDATGVGIIGDESVTTETDAYRQISTRSIQAASIKISRTGVGASRRIAALCMTAGASFVVGTQGESALGTHLASEVAAALPRAGLITTELCHAEFFEGQIVESDVFVQNGVITPSTDLNALRVDPEGIARFGVEEVNA